MSSNYGTIYIYIYLVITQIFIEEDLVPTPEEQPPAMSVKLCLCSICYSIKSVQLLILPSDWKMPFIPVAQLAMPIHPAPALALILTNGKGKQQNINFIPRKFLLCNLLLSSQDLFYSYHFLCLMLL